jgi:hypothetical protein
MVAFRDGISWKLFEANRLTEPLIWYVSYRSNIAPKRDDGERRLARATRKFKDEAAARQFAEEIIEKGWSAIAGIVWTGHMPACVHCARPDGTLDRPDRTSVPSDRDVPGIAPVEHARIPPDRSFERERRDEGQRAGCFWSGSRNRDVVRLHDWRIMLADSSRCLIWLSPDRAKGICYPSFNWS